MIAQCWLHIGTEKTGSTSIQTFFARNRAALVSRGWLYPEGGGGAAHNSLVAYGLDDARQDSTRTILGIGDRITLSDFRRQLIDSLTAEMARSGAAHLLLSSELLSTRLRRPSEIARVKALCDALAHRTSIIVYIRNQADFLVSRYTNVIWEGGTGAFDFRGRTAIADYALLLDRWSDVFGSGNVVVRRFEPADFPEGDVLRDFTDAIGLDIGGLVHPALANPSLDAESLAFLRAFNRRLPSFLAERVKPFRGALVRVLQRRRGKRFVIARSLAQRISDAYGESNARVSEVYFGSRDRPLFSPPRLVSAEEQPPSNGLGILGAARIGIFLAGGLLRDGWIPARKRRMTQAQRRSP
jgi:hypothetical protein